MRDQDQEQQKTTRLERYLDLFGPIFDGAAAEWHTLSVEEIVHLLTEQAFELCWQQERIRMDAIHEHQRQSKLVRWWRQLRGWTPPAPPNPREAILTMALRCEIFARDAEESTTLQSRADKRDFVGKPRQVAKRLRVLK